MSLWGSIKKLFLTRIDSDDRRKIRERRKPNIDGYDYRLGLQISESDNEQFSFLVVGDSGTGDEDKPAKSKVAEDMGRSENDECDFVLHLGDLVYLSGSKEGYPDRFIGPYKKWMYRSEHYKDLVFNKPFLPLYGNHDYYDFDRSLGLISKLFGKVNKEMGSGSENGQVFEDAFVINKPPSLKEGRLPYVPNEQTRIPNRYYWFTHRDCAFIALDSNTLDGLERPPGADKEEAKEIRKELEKTVKAKKKEVKKSEKKFEREDDTKTKESLRCEFEEKFDELVEERKKLEVQIKREQATKDDYDHDQLAWLKRVLKHEDVKDKWKIVYMHHPFYTSNGSHHGDHESIGLRENLQRMYEEHKVHVVFSGHSHCFEWIAGKRTDGEGYQTTCYIVSGGGGRNLHESILADPCKEEDLKSDRERFLKVAKSRAYLPKIVRELDQETNKIKCELDEVHHYLKITVKGEVLEIKPVGVVVKPPRSVPLSDYKVTVDTYTEVNDQIRTDTIKLRHINVYRDHRESDSS